MPTATKNTINQKDLIKWVKEQIELENQRLNYKHLHEKITNSYIEGRIAAFEKVLRVWDGE
jgi:hypothetical protein